MPDRIIKVYDVLNSLQHGPVVFLEYESEFQLLIGVILSAQTTDMQVNRVLPELFRTYPKPSDLAAADSRSVEEIIRSTGFFKVKAANIIKTAASIHETFNDRVPESMDDLLTLAGVGRKSANVIRGACFGKPAIIVDTHFARTVSRLDFTSEETPERIEYDLACKLPPKIQYRFSMLLNKLGRDYCKSRSPLCVDCPVNRYCFWPEKV